MSIVRDATAVHQAQLSEMELGEIVAYLQSIGYIVTVDRAEPLSAYVVPPSFTCQCYLCRARWDAVLEAGCE